MGLPIFKLLSFGVKTAADIYQTKKETKQLEALAERNHVERMVKGEVEYKKAVIASNDNGWKDEFVLVLISIPILLLGYSVISDDPNIRAKLDVFFEYFDTIGKILLPIFMSLFVSTSSNIFE